MDLKADPRGAWRKVNELFGKNKNLAPSEVQLPNSNGKIETTSDPLQMANGFNDFFREKISSLIKMHGKSIKLDPVKGPLTRKIFISHFNRDWLSHHIISS